MYSFILLGGGGGGGGGGMIILESPRENGQLVLFKNEACLITNFMKLPVGPKKSIIYAVQ